MKTIVNNIQFACANDATLILDVTTNKLIEVEYVKSLVDLGGNVTHIFSHNGKEVRIPQESDVFRLYASKDMFVHENEVENSGCFLDAGRTENHFKFVAQEDRNQVGVVSISFADGVPVEVEAPVTGFELRIHRGYTTITPIFDENVNLSEFFDSVEHATAFHDYNYYTKEGKKEIVKGRFAYILPTEEQQKVLDELRATINKAHEVGLGLMFNSEFGRLFGYNAKKTGLEYDGDGKSLCYLEGLYPESMKLPNPIYDYNCDSCYVAFEVNREEA